MNTKMLRGPASALLLLVSGALAFAACAGEPAAPPEGPGDDVEAFQPKVPSAAARPIDPAEARRRLDALATKDAALTVLDALQRLGCHPRGAASGLQLPDGSLALGDAIACDDGATGSLSVLAAEDGDLQEISALVSPQAPGADVVFVTPSATTVLTPEMLRATGEPGRRQPRGVLAWVRCRGCKLLVRKGFLTIVVGGSCEAAAGAACAAAGFVAAPLCLSAAQGLCEYAVGRALSAATEDACLRIGACP